MAPTQDHPETVCRGRLTRVLLLPPLLALGACGTPAPRPVPPDAPSPPTIESFAATPAAARVGEAVRFSYAGSGAASCALTTGQRRGPLTSCSQGEVTETYTAAGNYLAELVLSGPGGETRRGAPITVTEAPTARIDLFSGNGLGAWELKRGGAPNWRTEADYMEVVSGARVGENDLRTREVFSDFRLHLEFWVPSSPPGTSEQGRGNSGVYLQGRYEVQVLDSFGHSLSGENDAGAIYGVADATVNASRPPETWQTYDITFRAARFADGEKVEDARVSVVWNGVLVQDEVTIPGPTRLGDPETGTDGPLTGPVVLQAHGDPVRYRNIWLEPLTEPTP